MITFCCHLNVWTTYYFYVKTIYKSTTVKMVDKVQNKN